MLNISEIQKEVSRNVDLESKKKEHQDLQAIRVLAWLILIMQDIRLLQLHTDHYVLFCA